MSDILTLRFAHRAEFAAAVRDAMRRLARWTVIGVGVLLMVIGVPMALLPGHLGLPILVVGLIIVLRNSFEARRTFIRYQQRHPNVIFPIRRLLRREPEVLPVAWQQALRVERLILPRRWRKAGSLRRRYLRRKRA